MHTCLFSGRGECHPEPRLSTATGLCLSRPAAKTLPGMNTFPSDCSAARSPVNAGVCKSQKHSARRTETDRRGAQTFKMHVNTQVQFLKVGPTDQLMWLGVEFPVCARLSLTQTGLGALSALHGLV